MKTAITSSEAPVVVFVTPSGGRAASAGFFLLMAADVAAMSPGTNAGAAHPVDIGGQAAEKDGEKNVSALKAAEDAAAMIRSLAAARGRPVRWAERAVFDSRSYSADEALGHGLIDLVAIDRQELISELDGESVRRFDGRSQELDLAAAKVVPLSPTFAERVLMVVANPQVAYLLLMLGLLGLLVELTNPGGVVPAVAGGISLLLALYAFSVLPVSWVGVLLIVAGVGLMAAEVFATSYGLLALAGLTSFVFGSLMLVDTPVPALRIGPELVVPAAIVLAALSAFLATRAWRASRLEVKAGLEAIVGEEGEMANAIDPSRGEGLVFVHGEYWAATSDEPLPEGAKVRVERVEGRHLRVASLTRAAT
jgi:membrane-bound serine protease (ClpP class)